jgi:hypothetical protein
MIDWIVFWLVYKWYACCSRFPSRAFTWFLSHLESRFGGFSAIQKHQGGKKLIVNPLGF